jgi:hypothetical protein
MGRFSNPRCMEMAGFEPASYIDPSNQFIQPNCTADTSCTSFLLLVVV